MKNPLGDIILGIDPGTVITGYGLIHCHKETELLDYGCIRPPSSFPLNERYLIIYEAVETLLDKFSPTAVAVEDQFVYKNAQTALKLGMAKGVVILAATKRKIPIYYYAPKEAKLSVTGNGNASKEHVQKMIQVIFKLQKPPTPIDAADAVALALCHHHRRHSKHRTQGLA